MKSIESVRKKQDSFFASILPNSRLQAFGQISLSLKSLSKVLLPIFATILLVNCDRDLDREPVNSPISHQFLDEAFPVHNFQSYPLDLNQDGIQDFSINVMSVGFEMGVRHYFQIHSNRDARVMLTGEEITPLATGVSISPENTSSQSEWSIFTGSLMVRTVSENQADQWSGPWAPDKDYFAGLSIRIDGEYHYGWVKMQADRESNAIFVQEFAYHSKPNQPIIAGQRK